MIKSSNIKNINRALEALDKVSKTIIEVSYKIKDKSRTEDLAELKREFAKDMFVLREISEKTWDIVYELLSESMDIEDLYSMIAN